MHRLLAVSAAIDRVLAGVAHTTGWLFIAAIAVICFDVITRKIGYQLPYFTSTRLQELEWHITSTLFLGWIGYGVVRDTHVRIDVFTGNLAQRKKDWIELLGGIFFALPYALVVMPYAVNFAWTSFLQNEMSDAPNGLPARYVIKAITALGIILIFGGAVSVIARKLVDLFGPPELHSQAGHGPSSAEPEAIP